MLHLCVVCTAALVLVVSQYRYEISLVFQFQIPSHPLLTGMADILTDCLDVAADVNLGSVFFALVASEPLLGSQQSKSQALALVCWDPRNAPRSSRCANTRGIMRDLEYQTHRCRTSAEVGLNCHLVDQRSHTDGGNLRIQHTFLDGS